MRSVYFGVATALSAILAGILIWRKREIIRGSFSKVKTRGMARSVWGRVEQAAEDVAKTINNLTHTERDPA